MNLESFEKEIARLETQLQDAITALRVLKDIQATFQDMQPRYERLKYLTDEAARLPEHYAEQFASARKQAEARLIQLEEQLNQQQNRWEIALTQHQQIHNEWQQRTDQSLTHLQQHLEIQQAALDALVTQQQQIQSALEESITQVRTELQDSVITLDERATLANAKLKTFMEKALQDQAQKLREEFTRQFRWALLTGFIGWAIALGTLAVVRL